MESQQLACCYPEATNFCIQYAATVEFHLAEQESLTEAKARASVDGVLLLAKAAKAHEYEPAQGAKFHMPASIFQLGCRMAASNSRLGLVALGEWRLPQASSS